MGEWATLVCAAPDTICGSLGEGLSCVPNEPYLLGISGAGEQGVATFDSRTIYLMSIDTQADSVEVTAFGLVAPSGDALVAQMGIYRAREDAPSSPGALEWLTELPFVVPPGVSEVPSQGCLLLAGSARYWLAIRWLGLPVSWSSVALPGTSLWRVPEEPDTGNFPLIVDPSVPAVEGIGLSIFIKVRTRFSCE